MLSDNLFLMCSSTLILVGHSTLKIKMLIHWYNDTGAITVTEMPLKRHRMACTRLQCSWCIFMVKIPKAV